MKNISKIIFAILFSLALFSCSQEEQIEDSQTNKSLESVFSEMTKMSKAENKIIKFTLVIDKETDMYGYEHVRLLENSQHILEFNNGVQRAGAKSFQAGSYQVDCTDSEGNTTSTSCANYACVGYEVALCVEAGGCSTICNAEITIAP